MKILKIILAITIFSVFIPEGFSQAQKDTKRFYSDKYKFSLLKPTGWQIKENPIAAVAVAFSDKNGATIDVITEEKLGETNTEKYFKKNLEILKDNEDTKIGKNGKVTVNGLSAFWIIYSDKNSENKTLDYYFILNSTGIVLSANIKSSQFDGYEKTFRLISESLKQEKAK